MTSLTEGELQVKLAETVRRLCAALSTEWDEVRRWLEKARHDRTVSDLSLKHTPPMTDAAAFQVEQAVEPGLKGRNIKAQGNALGRWSAPLPAHALKGHDVKSIPHGPFIIINNDRGMWDVVVAPFQGRMGCWEHRRPWAALRLPTATIAQPFRLGISYTLTGGGFPTRHTGIPKGARENKILRQNGVGQAVPAGLDKGPSSDG